VAIRLKRVYEDPLPTDGFRILIDRLWPRGLTKERAAVNLWCKEVAPSNDLRVWFGHRHDRFSEFAIRYRKELDGNPAVDQLRAVIAEHSTVTLLYGAKDEVENDAVVLIGYL
jgi:uncharacterized protein YeaO (DUF488 family)